MIEYISKKDIIDTIDAYRIDAAKNRKTKSEIMFDEFHRGYMNGLLNSKIAIEHMPTTTEAEICRKFAERLKEKHLSLCALQDEENYQYPSYLEITDIYKHIDEVLAEMDKES